MPQVNTALPAPASQPGALSFDVTEADFEHAVLERSMQVPVLLDCWAPWCAPCRALGPVLEKLVKEYAGEFVLAKINTDEAPQVSAALRMRSIPLVVMFIAGQPVDQFLGALPEGQIRAFLEKHLQPQASPVDGLRSAAAAAADPQEAESLLQEALAMEPGHAEATYDLAELLIARGELEAAQALLDGIASAERGARHEPLVKRITLAKSRPQGDAAALAARIAANPKDFEARFDLAALQAFGGDWAGAFDELLEVVLRDKAEGQPQREKARLQLVEWFDLCPDAEAVSRGRRYLGMYLN